MMLYRLLSLFLFLPAALCGQSVTPKKTYPQNYFIPPLDIAPALAGSFGEIRGNHFHSGLDYRTQQREGLPVYAAADGYVSRLRVQIGGGGNIIYLRHPNGYTTVYMHLQRFSDRIAQTMKAAQYRQQVYDLDFQLLPIEVPVKKGEIIALSGNTGSTGGPHLHFEIRDSQTEETINAQLFGISIPDRAKPVIGGIYLYKLNGQPFSEQTSRLFYPVSGASGNYRLNPAPVIHCSNGSGFGIITYDQSVAGGNKLGVYSIELQLDGKTIFASAMESFSFSNSRAVNSHIDYTALLQSGRTVQKSFVEPGNPLGIYLTNNGLLDLPDDSIHTMKYIIMDVNGNTSTLSFKVQQDQIVLPAANNRLVVKSFAYNQDNEYTTRNLRVFIPKGNLYSNINFQYAESGKPSRGYSKLYHLHTRLVPLHEFYSIWIRPDSTLPARLRDKALIIDANRGPIGACSYEDGFIKGPARYFGSFYIGVDTIAPVIRTVNLTEGVLLARTKKIFFKVSDNLSGIKSFNATIDGKWALMEYDQKTATLWHTFDDEPTGGKHSFQLTVTDQKLNYKTFTANFTR